MIVISEKAPDVVDVAFAKVRDQVEESLVKEGDNVRLWQMRIKTAIEQVVLFTLYSYLPPPKNTTSNHHSPIVSTLIKSIT